MRSLPSLLIVSVLLCAGCAADSYGRYGLGEATEVVGASIETLGGAGRLLRAGPIDADAIVTLYDEAGTAYVNRQRQTYRLGAGTLDAEAALPEGPWSAHIRAGAAPSLEAGAALSAERRELLLKALDACQHRVRGPLNLLNVSGTGETAGKPQRVHLPGMEVFRVPVTGGDQDVKAYYFDARTYLLRLVSAGADQAGGEGTVTVYTYRVGPDGMAFPSRLRVVKIGRNVLVGDTPVLDVDFHHVTF